MNFFPDEVSDPGEWSTEALVRHGLRWADLPEMPGITRSMSDEDVEAHGEMLYIRGMVDDLTAAKAELTKEIKDFNTVHGQYPAEPLMWLQYLAHAAEMWVPSSLSFSEPWPEDRAAELLAVWRDELNEAA